jgi:predicted deacetylase
VHAFNVLRAAFQDKELSTETTSFAAQGLEVSIRAFSSPHWEVSDAFFRENGFARTVSPVFSFPRFRFSLLRRRKKAPFMRMMNYTVIPVRICRGRRFCVD